MKHGERHSDAAKAKTGRGVARAWRRRKVAGKVALADVHVVERGGTASPVALPFLPLVRTVYENLVEEQGGEAHISTARRTLLDGHSRLLLAEILCGVRIAQDPSDLDAMARLTALVGMRRSLLVSLGLDRVARDVPALSTYLATRQNGEAPTLDVQPTPEPEEPST